MEIIQGIFGIFLNCWNYFFTIVIPGFPFSIGSVFLAFLIVMFLIGFVYKHFLSVPVRYSDEVRYKEYKKNRNSRYRG